MNDVVTELKNLIINAKKSYYEYLKDQEVAVTEREKNIAQVKALSSALKARRDVAETFTSHFFEERKMLRELTESVLSKAVENGDAILAQLTMELIEFEYNKNLFGKYNRLI